MTHAEAVEIRRLQLQGKATPAEVLEEALLVIRTTVTPTKHFNGRKQKRKPKVQVDMSAAQQQPPPPPEPEPEPPRTEPPPAPAMEVPVFIQKADEDPHAVVKALRPWALIAPNTSLDPEGYVWPKLGEGVDIDAVHGRKP
ncbi:MAG: hypothetical protein JWQ03_1626 [Variovorax sp.]|nr:hypothetical protein [Variovorax sp.]